MKKHSLSNTNVFALSIIRQFLSRQFLSRQFLKILLFIFLPVTGMSQGGITGPDEVVEGQSYTYNLSKPLSGTWSADNGLVTASNGDPGNGILYANVTWNISPPSQHDTRGVVVFTLSTGESITYVVHKMNLGEAIHNCLQIAPLFQVASYSQSPQNIIASACLTAPSGYYITWEWEYMDLPGDFKSYASSAYNDPRFIPPSTWVSPHAVNTAEIAPFVMNVLGSMLYRCKVSLYETSGNHLLKSVYTGISQVILPEFSAGEISHNSSYPVNAHTPDGLINVALNAQILQIGEDPSLGGLCTTKTYTWEISYEGGVFFTLCLHRSFSSR